MNVTWDNEPPVADAGPDKTADEGEIVTLDASNSSDPDDGIAAYLWTQTDGVSVTLPDKRAIQPTFAAPDVGPGGDSLLFSLAVTDHHGLQSSDSCIVNVTWDNEPPVADAGPDQTADEGAIVTLDAFGSSDPDDGIAAYFWTQTNGPRISLSDPRVMQPSFAAPQTDIDDTDLTFLLTIEDNLGLRDTDEVRITVSDSGDEALTPSSDEEDEAETEEACLDCPCSGHTCFLGAAASGSSFEKKANFCILFCCVAILMIFFRKKEKKMKRMLIITAFMLTANIMMIPTAIHAQENSFYMGFHGGYASENLDTQALGEKFATPVNLSFDNSWGIQLRGGTVINEYLSAEVMAEYISPFEDGQGDKNVEVEVINVGVNCKAGWPISRHFRPYVTVGAGLMNSREEIRCRDQICKNDEWGMSLRAGIGAEMFISPAVSVSAEGAHLLGLGNTEDMRYTLISLGVNYYF